MTTTPLAEHRTNDVEVAPRLETAGRQLSQLEDDLRQLWHHLVADEPLLAARVRIAANHLRNAAAAMSLDTAI